MCPNTLKALFYRIQFWSSQNPILPFQKYQKEIEKDAPCFPDQLKAQEYVECHLYPHIVNSEVADASDQTEHCRVYLHNHNSSQMNAYMDK